MPAAPALDATARGATLDRLEREAFDLAIIGGGISGAGLAREAQLRGLRVALLEARDFAEGTSSRSSKLIHGGLRYLAMGDVALVRSTARERQVIHRLAPHLAVPAWMVIPTRSRAGLAKLLAAVTTYEKLGAVAPADRHRTWTRDDLAQEEPLLRTERYGFACAYREYVTDDARLVLANLRAAAADGAAALNHAPVVSIDTEAGRAAAITAECRESGRRVRVRARCVVNAAGPWVDPLRALEDASAAPRLQLSKGVHLVFPAERLPVRNLLILNTTDRRSIFVVPRGQCVYVGTTDTAWSGGPSAWPDITAADVQYLLEPLARDLSAAPPTSDDVVAGWAGLRPLIAQPGKAPKEISRKDEVWIGPSGVVTLAGGKLTGYRPMARMAVERAALECGLSLAPASPEDPPLPGGDFGEGSEGDLEALASGLAGRFGLDLDPARRLAHLYGSEAASVLEQGATPLIPGGFVVAGEIDQAIRHEAALHLEDVVYRRTRAALYRAGEREALLEPVAARMALALSWSAELREREIARARDRMQRELSFGESEGGET